MNEIQELNKKISEDNDLIQTTCDKVIEYVTKMNENYDKIKTHLSTNRIKIQNPYAQKITLVLEQQVIKIQTMNVKLLEIIDKEHKKENTKLYQLLYSDIIDSEEPNEEYKDEEKYTTEEYEKNNPEKENDEKN